MPARPIGIRAARDSLERVPGREQARARAHREPVHRAVHRVDRRRARGRQGLGRGLDTDGGRRNARNRLHARRDDDGRHGRSPCASPSAAHRRRLSRTPRFSTAVAARTRPTVRFQIISGAVGPECISLSSLRISDFGSMLALLNRSVRFKLIAVILATTLAALLVASAALLSYDVRSYRQGVIADIRTQAAFLADANTVALQYDDRKLAQESLAPLTIRPDILAAAIYTAEGQLFASYEGRGRGELGRAPAEAPAELRGASRTPVRFEGGVTELLVPRSEEHTSELQSRENLVCRLLLEKKKISITRRKPSTATRAS